MRTAHILIAVALSGSALTGCASSEARPQTVHCMKCHRVVSAENVVCTDCAAPRSDPMVVDDGPPPPSKPGQPVVDPVPDNTPPAPLRRATARDARVLFLNNFPRAESDKIEAELVANPEFVDVTPGGGDPGRRVSLDFKFVGSNLKARLVQTMRKLGYRFHFTEARLDNQVELVRE